MPFIGNTIPSLSSSNFQKILKFYLLECPVKTDRGRVAQRGLIFEQRGFQKHKLTLLLTAMKKMLFGNIIVFKTSNGDNRTVESELERSGIANKPEFVVVRATNTTNTEAIFYCIRNAMAHGTFSVSTRQNDIFYHFESHKDGKLRGRVCLNEETLLQWINLIEKGTNAYHAGTIKEYKDAKALLIAPKVKKVR